MPVMKFTDLTIKQAKSDPSKRVEYFDANPKHAGLVLCVQPSGNRSFAYRFKLKINGEWENRKKTLKATTLADAFAEHGSLASEVAIGRDPCAIRHAAASGSGSLAEAVELYRKGPVAELSDHTRGYIEHDLARLTDALPGVALTDVRKSDLVAILDGVMVKRKGKGGPGAANITRKVFRQFFKWCAGRSDDFVSPAADLLKPAKDNVRKRVLSNTELAAVWKHGSPLVRLLLLTGARRDEIAGLRHDEIGKTEITIPAERTKKTKAGQFEHVIHITPLMRSVLDKLPTTGEHALTGNGHAPTGYSKMKAELDAAVGFDDWVLHDLRRTFRSKLAELGVTFEVAEKCLGHQFVGVHKTYNLHKYKAEMAEAWETYSRFVMKLTRDLRVAA